MRGVYLIFTCAFFPAYFSILASVLAQTSPDPVAPLVGSWDLPGTRVNIEIRANHVVQHWKLGTGDIVNENSNFFKIFYHQHNLICRYEIKKYSPDELTFVATSDLTPAECSLGVMRRAPAGISEPWGPLTKRQQSTDGGRAGSSDIVNHEPQETSVGHQKDEAQEPEAGSAPPPNMNHIDPSAPPKPIDLREDDIQKKNHKAFKDCSTCPEVVVVPAGTFLMGSPDYEHGRSGDNEGPQRRVIVGKAFAVGRFAITVDEFKVFVSETGYRTDDRCGAYGEFTPTRVGSFEAPPGFNAGFIQAGNHPVVCISWHDAKAYVAWLSQKTKKSYRLLTEAEREYVTRAGTTTSYWWGAGITPAQALYETRPAPKAVSQTHVFSSASTRPGAKLELQLPPVDEFEGRTAPVNQYKPNDWGLYQVHGNVAEWTEDCWTPTIASSSSSAMAVTTANCSAHVIRGGAWSYAPEKLRAAFRESAPADGRYNHIGFRVARDLESK